MIINQIVFQKALSAKGINASALRQYHIAPSTIHKIYTGQELRFSTIYKIAEALGVDVDELIEEKTDPLRQMYYDAVANGRPEILPGVIMIDDIRDYLREAFEHHEENDYWRGRLDMAKEIIEEIRV